MTEPDLLRRITSDPTVFSGKPTVRGKRLAVEHVLSILAAGDGAADLVAAHFARGESRVLVTRAPRRRRFFAAR